MLRRSLLVLVSVALGCGAAKGSTGGSSTGGGSGAATGGSANVSSGTSSSGISSSGATGGAGGVGGSSVAFPLVPSSSGRYLVDQHGTPFRVHGDASWDAHINLSLADLQAYLDDRRAKGFNALFTYVTNPVAYAVGSAAPWAVELGGRGVAGALPFTQNAMGGAWDGDPTFAHHDASFASPNDAYFAWVGQFVDEAAERGMVVMMAPMYLGYALGANDGWYQTIVNAANTQSVCHAFGSYLADGHGAFTGFKNRPNIIWVEGGDTLPPNGSEGALRAVAVVQGMQEAGDTHLQTAHWQHDYLTLDQTDFAPYITAYAAYTHGSYPVIGPTYAESRALYGEATVRPTWLLETNYWGDHGATRAQVRGFAWASGLSTIGGTTFGFTPLWIFATSPDGSTGNAVTGTTAWTPGTTYVLNQYASKGGMYYRATTPGTSGTTGPSGTGSSIADGTVTWAYAAAGTWKALLDEPVELDMAHMGAFMNSIAWYELVPSGLGGAPMLVTAGGGTYASWSDGNSEGGGLDWVVSAVTSDDKLLVAYTPDAHTGPLTIAMSALAGSARARWYDPTSGAYTADPSGTGYVLPNMGTHLFTSPGVNGAGDQDWVLVVDTP